MNFWRISKCGQEFLKIRKGMEKGQASVGLLLPAGGPWQGLARGPQAGVGWVGLLVGPPVGRKRSRGASTWAPGAADGPRREEAQDLKKRRPSALAYRCSAA